MIKNETIKIQQIRESMPHRYPFLLVDRVVGFESEEGVNKSIHAYKNVTCNEEFFNGHFPARPIMPGVLQIEALAQAAGLLIFSITNSSDLYYFAGIDNVRFKRVVEPGDQLNLHATLIKRKRDVWFFEAKSMVDGELACSAELILVKGEM